VGLTFASWAAFGLTCAAIELTPGPNMGYLAIVGATDGRRSGYAAVAGVALGLALVGGAAALGLAAVINASDALFQTLRWAGVFYLVWLAWDGWQAADGPIADVPGGTSRLRYFRRGLVTNLLNPKAAVFYVALLPGFVVEGAAILPQTLILSATFVVIATGIHLVIVTLARAARPFLEDPHRSRIVRRVLSAALALIAVWFAIDTAG